MKIGIRYTASELTIDDGGSSLVVSYRRAVIKRCAIISAILIEATRSRLRLFSLQAISNLAERENPFPFRIKKRTPFREGVSVFLRPPSAHRSNIVNWYVIYVNWRITYSPLRLPRKLSNVIEMFVSNITWGLLWKNDEKGRKLLLQNNTK